MSYDASLAELQRNIGNKGDGRALFKTTCTYVRLFDTGGVFGDAEQAGQVTLHPDTRVDLCYSLALYDWFFKFEKIERLEIDNNRLRIARKYGELASLVSSTSGSGMILYKNVRASQEVRELEAKQRALLGQRRRRGNRHRDEADFFLASLARIYSSAGGTITVSPTSSFARFLTAIWQGLPKDIQVMTAHRMVVRAGERLKIIKDIGHRSTGKLPAKERKKA